MTRTGHMSVKRGKRVLVIMKAGPHILAKFREKNAHTVFFFDHDPISQLDIRTLSIYRGPTQ